MSGCPYENNPFCRALSPEDRAALCGRCRVFPFKKKIDAQANCLSVSRKLPAGESFCTVVLNGMLCTNSSQNVDSPKAYLLWQPGDIMNTEFIFDSTYDDLTSSYHHNYITDGMYALLPGTVLRERFAASPAFAAFLFNSLSHTRLRQTEFLLSTQLRDAKSALIYLLLFCQEHKLPALTHQDFAYLTGLNRTTVTKMLKKILLSEDLDIPLKDYIRSMYAER